MKRLTLVLVVGLVVFGLFPASISARQDGSGNITDGCVEDYDVGTDYFPEKVSVTHATGFQVEYFNNYKVLTVTNPWYGAEVVFEYVLVQCGTPTPAGYDDAQIVSVPVETIIPMSTTYLPHLDSLGLVDRIVALDSFDYVNTISVLERADMEDIAAIGYGAGVNVEVVLELDPGLVMTYGSGFPDYDAHPVLLEAGVPVALSADFMESDPLGYAEWGKFIALFFNKEADASAIFETTVQEYDDLTALTENLEDRPTVLLGSSYDGQTWYLPGGASYSRQLLDDAGAVYVFADDPSQGSTTLDIEVVIDRAAGVDFWLNPSQVFWNTVDDVLAADERYGEFSALEAGHLYNNNMTVTPAGGIDYLESGSAFPQRILADMIAIFHPDLLPDHEMNYYRQIQ